MRRLRSILKLALGGLLLSGVTMLAGCRESYVSYSEDSYPVYDYYPGGDFFVFGDSDDFHHRHHRDFDGYHRDFDGGHRNHGVDRGGEWSGSAHSGGMHSFSSGGHSFGGHSFGGHGGGGHHR